MIGSQWWQDGARGDGLLVALDYINEARHQPRHRPGWELDSCANYFRAWNQLANNLDWPLPPASPHPDRPEPRARRGEAEKHRKVLTQLSEPELARLMGEPSVAAFARFAPLILDHGSPGMSQRLADVTDEVSEAASQQHREFRNSWIRWEGCGSGMAQTLSKLVRAVLVVRNNIQHGEKTPSGPDMQRRQRNQDVGRVVLPLLSAIIEAVLDHPSKRLIAYGTLRPGQPNEGIITVPGRWSTVTITGSIRDESGLPAYEADVSGGRIPAGLFSSDRLPNIWPVLDAFEGSNYERRLAMYFHEDGIGVANIYGWAGDAW